MTKSIKAPRIRKSSKKAKTEVLTQNAVEAIETNPGEFSTTVGIEDMEIIASEILDGESLTSGVMPEGSTMSPEEAHELEQQVAEQMNEDNGVDVGEIVEQLEARDEANAETVSVLEANTETVTDQDPPASEVTAKTWDEALNAISQDAVDAAVLNVAKAIDDRAAFEKAKDENNATIQRTLKKARAQLATKAATRAMLVCGFNEANINRSRGAASVRYNVYALGKLADVLNAVGTDRNIGNAVNNAILRSLFKLRSSTIAFTMEVAKAAVSDKIRVDTALRNLLVRHTVAASTAPTQASSTMQALVDLGVVSRSGPEKTAVFSLTEAPIVAKLEAVLQGA